MAMDNKWEGAVFGALQRIEYAIKGAPEGADLTVLDAQHEILKEIINHVKS